MTDAQTNSDGQSNVEAFIEGIGAKAKKIAETRVSDTLAAASEARTSLADFGSSLVDHHFGDATDDQVLTSATKAIEGITNTVVTGLGGQDLAHAVTGLEDSGRDLGGKLIDYHFGAATSDQVLDAAGKVGADVSNAIVTGLAGKDTADAIAGARDSGSDLIKTGIDYHFGDATGDQVLDAVGKTGGAVSNAIVTGLGSKDLASAVTEARDRVSDLAKTAIDYQFGDATGEQVLDAAGKAGGDISNAIVTGLAGKDAAAAVTKARDGTSDLVGTGIDYHFGDATGEQVLDAAGKASGDVSNAIVTGLAGKDVATAVTKARDGTSDLVGTGIDYHFGDATGEQVLDAAGKASGDISNAIVTGLAGEDVAAAVTKARDSTSDLVGTGIDYHFGDATSDQVLDAAGKASGDVSNAIVTGLADKDVAAAVATARDSTSDLARTGIDYQFGDATSDQVLDAAGKTAGTISDAIVTDLAGSGSAEAVRRGREGVSELVGEAIDNLTETDGPATPANDNVETVQDEPDFSPPSDDSDVSNSGSQQLAGDSDDADANAQNDGVQDSVATASDSYDDVAASDTSDASTVAAADSQNSSVASQDSYDTESEAQPVGDDSVDRADSSDSYGAETDTRRDDGDVSDSASAQDVGTVQSDAWGAPDGSTRADDAADDPGEPGQEDSYRSSQDNDDSSESGVRSDADAAGPTLATLNDSYGDEVPAPEPSSSDTSDSYQEPDSGGAYQASAAGSDAQTSFQSETYNSSDDAVREVPDDNSDSYSETSIPDSVVETSSTSDDSPSDAGAFTSTYSVSAGPEVTSDSDTGGGGYDAGSSGADIVAGSGGESD